MGDIGFCFKLCPVRNFANVKLIKASELFSMTRTYLMTLTQGHSISFNLILVWAIILHFLLGINSNFSTGFTCIFTGKTLFYFELDYYRSNWKCTIQPMNLVVNLRNFWINKSDISTKFRADIWNPPCRWSTKTYMSSWKSSKEGDLPLCILPKREILRETFPRH